MKIAIPVTTTACPPLLRLFFLVAILAIPFAADAAGQRPFRGTIGISVLLCKYRGAPTPARTRDYYANLVINRGTGGHADYWDAVSFGSIDFRGSVVRGWYTLDKTADESRAYGGGGSPNRGKKFTDCVDKAREQGYTPPSDHIVIVITSPNIDTFGSHGRVFLGEGVSAGAIIHETGHGLSLSHSFSDDPTYTSTWGSIGEYDDLWDAMSFAHVFGANTGAFGIGGPGLNAYNRDRLGWIARDKILRFGADGQIDQTVTLTSLNRPNGRGYQMIRIPTAAVDLYSYYTVEYRANDGWDSGFPSDLVLIHAVGYKSFEYAVPPKPGKKGYWSFLFRQRTGTRAPVQSFNRDGVRIDVISKDPANGRATVRIRSTGSQRCIVGFWWRGATVEDRICVSRERYSEVRAENAQAAQRRAPGTGVYSQATGVTVVTVPITCKQGFVWREATNDDRVCVTGASREKVRQENQDSNAQSRTVGAAAYGPNSCKQGYVWRDADTRDWVCVSPRRRANVRSENQSAASRRQPGGGPYGPDSCKSGFVWREAFPGDRVCVTRDSRRKIREENQTASDRLAKRGA